MMNRDKLMGAIGSSLIGVGASVILYAIKDFKKNAAAEEAVEDVVMVDDEIEGRNEPEDGQDEE